MKTFPGVTGWERESGVNSWWRSSGDVCGLLTRQGTQEIQEGSGAAGAICEHSLACGVSMKDSEPSRQSAGPSQTHRMLAPAMPSK